MSGGQILRNAIAICEMLADRKHLMNGDLGNHLKDQLFFWCTGGISPKLRERQIENSSIRKESITRNLFWISFDRGRNLERRHSDC